MYNKDVSDVHTLKSLHCGKMIKFAAFAFSNISSKIFISTQHESCTGWNENLFSLPHFFCPAISFAL